MTAATEAPAPVAGREYGVRVWQAGEPDTVIPCEDLGAAEAVLQSPPQGLISVEIVGRATTTWKTAPEGLAASVRSCAEQYFDKEVGDSTVDERLTEWLRDDDRHPLEIAGAFRRLVATIEWLRAAEDGRISRHVDRGALVHEREELVAAAVRRVIGGGQ